MVEGLAFGAMNMYSTVLTIEILLFTSWLLTLRSFQNSIYSVIEENREHFGSPISICFA